MAATLGEGIREKRIELNLSVSDLAEHVGVDPSVMQLIEGDYTSPSVAVLRRIAATLRTPLFYFLGDQGRSVIVKKGQRRLVEIRKTGVRHELLVPGLHRGIEVFISNLPACSRDPEPMGSHPGEKCILVLEGEVNLRLGREVHVLRQGDSIYFDCTTPHYVESGDGAAMIVTAVTPPML
jgi:transcriptional regulator with XRE-family HTH domain